MHNDPNDTDADFGFDGDTAPAEDDANPFGDEGEDYGDGTGSSGGGDDGEDDVFELPPEPVGVLAGFTTAKRWAQDPKKVIVTITITEDPFQKAEPLEMWFDMSKAKDLKRLMSFGAGLGVAIKKQGNTVIFPGGVGQAFHEKIGKFMIASWDKDDGNSDVQAVKWFQAPGKSQAWDAHMADLAERNESYTEDQMKQLKKCSGVLPMSF